MIPRTFLQKLEGFFLEAFILDYAVVSSQIWSAFRVPEISMLGRKGMLRFSARSGVHCSVLGKCEKRKTIVLWLLDKGMN